jgi:hypothetical protein
MGGTNKSAVRLAFDRRLKLEFHGRTDTSSRSTDNGDELLNGKIYDNVLIDRWRRQYYHVRASSILNYQPPVPETRIPKPELHRKEP